MLCKDKVCIKLLWNLQQEVFFANHCCTFFFKVSFADAAPYMMATEGTLERVNNDLKSPVTIDRFRPNIVISGPEAFGEVFFIYTQNLLKTVCYR